MTSSQYVFLSWTRRMMFITSHHGTPTRDAAVAGLPPPGSPELLSGSCSRPPRASPRGKWSTAGLRRDPRCHLSAEVLPPRSHSLLPAVSEPGHWRKRCRERCSYTTDFGHDHPVLALRLADGYDETLSAEVRGPSVPCQGFIRMTFSLNGLIRRCSCAVITATGPTHARLALCFSLSKRASG
jgi:hypothetical protein